MRIPVFGTDSNWKVDPPLIRQNKGLVDQMVAEGNARWNSPDPKDGITTLKTPRFRRPEPITKYDPATRPASGVCEICSFSRFVEKAHIVPARFGGATAPHNLLDLCPNHHRLFDRNMLTVDEFGLIWPRINAAISMRNSDPMFQEWRAGVIEKYRLSVIAQ